MKIKLMLLFVISLVCSMAKAQLPEKDLAALTIKVKNDYANRGMTGSYLYKTSSGYRVLVVVVDAANPSLADEKARRMATEYIVGAENNSLSVYELSSDMSSSKESLTDKIIQSSLGQVRNMEALCRISDTVSAYFLVISKTNAKKGVAGLLSMVIPGAGQFYKGSTTKGAVFLGLTAVAAAGVIVCEATRSQYVDKINNVNNNLPMYSSEDANALLKEYGDKKKSWRTGTYLCAGAAGVIYIWNVLDAFISKGAQRPVVTTKRGSLTVAPKAGINNVGVSFAFNF